jgi:hypothetical protein
MSGQPAYIAPPLLLALLPVKKRSSRNVRILLSKSPSVNGIKVSGGVYLGVQGGVQGVCTQCNCLHARAAVNSSQCLPRQGF